MAGEEPVRLGFPSGHRREDVHPRTHVGPGADEHDDHGMHDDVLQVCYNIIIM